MVDTIEWTRYISLKVDPFSNLEDILIGERALRIEIVASLALHSPHELTHVSSKTVL